MGPRGTSQQNLWITILHIRGMNWSTKPNKFHERHPILCCNEIFFFIFRMRIYKMFHNDILHFMAWFSLALFTIDTYYVRTLKIFDNQIYPHVLHRNKSYPSDFSEIKGSNGHAQRRDLSHQPVPFSNGRYQLVLLLVQNCRHLIWIDVIYWISEGHESAPAIHFVGWKGYRSRWHQKQNGLQNCIFCNKGV